MRILIEVLRIFRFVSIVSLLTIVSLLFAFSAGWFADRAGALIQRIAAWFHGDAGDGSET